VKQNKTRLPVIEEVDRCQRKIFLAVFGNESFIGSIVVVFQRARKYRNRCSLCFFVATSEKKSSDELTFQGLDLGRYS
jgi:hypothetical protein